MRVPVSLYELSLFTPGEVVSVGAGPEHFGVLTWRGTVVSASKMHGEIVEEGLLQFAGGQQVFAHGVWSDQPWQDTMQIAFSQLGQPYRLFDNNCEHFVRYCHGLERKSPQLAGAIGVGIAVAALCVFATTAGRNSSNAAVRWI